MKFKSSIHKIFTRGDFLTKMARYDPYVYTNWSKTVYTVYHPVLIPNDCNRDAANLPLPSCADSHLNKSDQLLTSLWSRDYKIRFSREGSNKTHFRLFNLIEPIFTKNESFSVFRFCSCESGTRKLFQRASISSQGNITKLEYFWSLSFNPCE